MKTLNVSKMAKILLLKIMFIKYICTEGVDVFFFVCMFCFVFYILQLKWSLTVKRLKTLDVGNTELPLVANGVVHHFRHRN